MEDDVLEQLRDLVEELEDENEDIARLIQSHPEVESDCSVKKETLDEIIRKINFIISEFTIIE